MKSTNSKFGAQGSVGFGTSKRETVTANKNLKQVMQEPGPGQYSEMMAMSSTKKAYGKFSKEERLKTERLRSPGPGQYEAPIKKITVGAKIGTSQRPQTAKLNGQNESYGPGPGGYEIGSQSFRALKT